MAENTLLALATHLDSRYSSYRGLDRRFLFPIRLSAAICLYIDRGIRNFIRASVDLQTAKSARPAGIAGNHGSSGRYRHVVILCPFRLQSCPGVPSPVWWDYCRDRRVCLCPQKVSHPIALSPRSESSHDGNTGLCNLARPSPHKRNRYHYIYSVTTQPPPCATQSEAIRGVSHSFPLIPRFWAVGPAALPCAGGVPPQRPPSKPDRSVNSEWWLVPPLVRDSPRLPIPYPPQFPCPSPYPLQFPFPEKHAQRLGCRVASVGVQ